MRLLPTWLLAATACASQQSMSTRMLDSIIARKQGIVDSGAASSTLESGILAQAFEYAIAQYPSAKCRYSAYLSSVLDIASSALTNASHAATRPLDRFSLATAIDSALASGAAPVTARSRAALDAVNASLALQTRNPDGGLWYYVYPQWSYLDGIFSLLPFMSALPLPRANRTDMALQISLLRDRCTQQNTSLLLHGYDWSRTAVWADGTTGASPYVWGRSLGWFLAGLVQTWDRLSCYTDAEPVELCSLVRNMTVQVCGSLVRHADPDTGAWWQMVTLPGVGANYLESSSTALFTFSILKALRTGLLQQQQQHGGQQPDYKGTALKAYNYTLDRFVTDTGNGTIGFDKTVSVCSLNSTATFDYYTTRPLVPNSLLGESAFVLAALEVERLK